MVQKYGVTFKKRLQSNDLVLNQIYLNLEIEKIHIKFSKYILGVNKRATGDFDFKFFCDSSYASFNKVKLES
jgi:hypothetical protein